ncbi:MAG: hypothetical protein ACI4OT_01480 [Bacilli bacterium]
MKRDLMIRKNNLNIYKAVDFDEFIYICDEIQNIYNNFTNTFDELAKKEFEGYAYTCNNSNGEIEIELEHGFIYGSRISLFILNNPELNRYYPFYKQILKIFRYYYNVTMNIYDLKNNLDIEVILKTTNHENDTRLFMKCDSLNFLKDNKELKPDKIYVSTTFNDYKIYKNLLKIVKEHQQMLDEKDLKNFFVDNKVNPLYKNQTLEKYNLSNINFDNKNISGIDISKNPEVHINFDKIVKDLTNSNIRGYNLNKYTFRNYNLTNTDLRNTGATIDILSCNINTESKMSSGTLFDENNKFIIGNQKIPGNEIEKYGIKIKK